MSAVDLSSNTITLIDVVFLSEEFKKTAMEEGTQSEVFREMNEALAERGAEVVPGDRLLDEFNTGSFPRGFAGTVARIGVTAMRGVKKIVPDLANDQFMVVANMEKNTDEIRGVADASRNDQRISQFIELKARR